MDTSPEEENIQKSEHVRNAAANFVANGWKLVAEDSLKGIKEYGYSTFKRMQNKSMMWVFDKIYHQDVLELCAVRRQTMLHIFI